MCQKVLILKGLPGSGKSTWAKKFIEKNQDYVRVCRDDLRNMRGKYWFPEQEDLISQMEFSCIILAIDSGKNVIIDATNLNEDRLKKFKLNISSATPKNKVKFEEKFFDVPLNECIKRDSARSRTVGERVIKDMYEKYLHKKNIYNENLLLPHAIICDIDGTLALNKNGRSPYDWHRVEEDIPNKVVMDLLYTYHKQNIKIILFSGRDEICKEETERWLKSNGIHYDSLFMRFLHSQEKDSIIKKDLFERNIRGNYYIDFVLDDRNQVVDMWRKDLGLACFQVNYGDF